MTKRARRSRSARQRPRRNFERAVALARFRWEILRRTSEYRSAFLEVLRSVAKTMGEKWSEQRLGDYCLNKEGGVLMPVSGEGVSSREHYYNLCARYGLRVLLHPDVSFLDDEMGAYPVFADTPVRQPVVRDQAKLRRVAMRRHNISPRTLRRIFSQKRIDAGPYRVQVGRVRLGQLDSMLAVFDRRRDGMTFTAIARQLDLKIDQVKRAWRRARSLIENRVDLNSHFQTCRMCQKLIAEGGADLCPVAEAQIGTARSQSVGSRAMPIDRLERDHARHRGEAPARGAYKRPAHSEDWNESLLKLHARGRRRRR